MTPFIERLGDFAPLWGNAMWRAAWQGGLAIAVVWVLCLTFPNVPARMRCWWWRLAFAKLLLCLFWAAPIKLALLPAAKPKATVVSKVELAQVSVSPPKFLPVPVPALPPTVFAAPAAKISVSPHAARPSVMSVLLVLWILGVVAGLLGIARQWWLARRLIPKSRILNHEQIESDLALLSARFGIRSLPQVRMADGLGTPLLSGLRHPAILVPPSFLHDKTPPQLRMMIAHELAHIKRRDLLWVWLAMAARVLFFFHPLVLLARKESRLTEEMAADELAVTVCRLEPVDYAGMLVEVAARLLRPQAEELVVGVIGSHRTLKRRLQAMKYIHSLSNRRMTIAVVVFTVVGLGAIVPWQVTAQESKPEEPRIVRARSSPAEIGVDAEGNYKYAGRVMAADEIVAALKDAMAGDHKSTIAIHVDPKAPFRRLVALFDKLDEAGISRVSLAAPASVLSESPQPLQASPPQIFDIDFGVAPSKQTGPAAAGREGDFWNTVSVAWNNDHTESGMKFASGEPSPVQVRMINLGGGWGSSGKMGVNDPMLDCYNYPVNNQGGNSTVILKAVPPGTYDIYIYGHEVDPVAYGDYTLTVGSHKYGRKATSNKDDAITNATWVEGSQYVKYSGIEIGSGDDVNILIKPGGLVTDHWGRTFSDAVICGLQLVPVR